MPSRARPRVGYLGPEGTFSEEALLASAARDAVEPVPVASIYDAVSQLRAGELEWAVVPIENSLDGSIRVTLDLLAQGEPDLQIVAEALLRVRHSLIASELLSLTEIDTVISHPQVPGQCQLFLRGELPHARILAAASTAEAVRIVTSERRAGQAAIGTRLAADIYGGSVIREGVEDSEDNQTRFVWLARAGQPQTPPLEEQARGQWKTSLVFWGPGAEHPGWLVRCLSEFAHRDINLTRIESRPWRARLGSYMFFADLTGHIDEEPIAAAIAGVCSICEEVRVLGCYRGALEP